MINKKKSYLSMRNKMSTKLQANINGKQLAMKELAVK
jgi:hypothetical protein